MVLGNKMKIGLPSDESKIEQVRTPGAIEDILRYIETRYVEAQNGQMLTQVAIESILNELDPHSQYLSPSKRREVEEEMQGEYFGIGIEKMHIDSQLFVLRSMKDSPAEKAGLLPGDRILSILDTVNIASGISSDSLQIILRGEAGTVLPMTYRTLTDEEKDVTIERAPIALPSIDIAYMLDDSIAYVKINRFASETYKEFMKSIEDMAELGMDDLVIDVRDNPGGYLQETVKILSQIVEKEKALLVYTEGANSKRVDYKTTGRQFYDLDDVVVLINDGSASASEILAGALQDLDRGLIVGRRSFGKGLVQEQYPLNNGAAIRLTTARYYTPSGRLIQRDYSDREHYLNDDQYRESNGELVIAQHIPVEDTTKHYTEAGRLVYGGGGITPDIFIADSNPFTNEQWPHVDYFIQAYVASHYGELIKLTEGVSQEDFISKFELSAERIIHIVDYLSDKFPLEAYEDLDVEQVLGRRAKAYIGKMKFNDIGVFIRTMNQGDAAIAEALNSVRSKKVDKILLKN